MGSKPGSGGGTPAGQTPAVDVGGLKNGPKSKQRPSMGGNATLAELRGALTRRKQVDYQGQFFSDAKTLFEASRINDISKKMSASDLTGGGNPASLAGADAAMSDGSATGADPSLTTQSGPAGSNSGSGSSSDVLGGGNVPPTDKALTAAQAAAEAAKKKAAELEEYQKSRRAYKAAQESKTLALMQPILEDPRFCEGWTPTMEEGQEVAASMAGWKALLIMLGTNEDKIRNSGEGAKKLLDQGKHVLALVNFIQNRDSSQVFWRYLTGKVAHREPTYDAMKKVTHEGVYYPTTIHKATAELKLELVAKALWHMQIVIRTPTKREENDLYQKQLAETKERKAKQESKLKRKMQKGRGRKEAQASSSRTSSNARGRSTSAGPNKKGKREDGPSGQQKQQKQQDSGRKKGTKGKRFGTDSAEKNFATANKQKRSDGTE